MYKGKEKDDLNDHNLKQFMGKIIKIVAGSLTCWTDHFKRNIK